MKKFDDMYQSSTVIPGVCDISDLAEVGPSVSELWYGVPQEVRKNVPYMDTV